MTEIKVFELEMEDAYKLDTLFSACAKAAFREAKMQPKINKESQKKNGRVTAYNSESKEFPINEHGLDVLYSCYTSSKFVYPDTQHKKDVKYRLGYELSRVAPANYSPNFELLFPIMVYAILINNEYNYETVRRRVREDKAKGKHDEKCVWKYVDPFSIRHRKTAMTCKEFSKRVTQLENAIALTGRPELEDNNCVIQTFILLSSYKMMKEYQDSAIIALFLRNILLNSFRRDRLMDMLIRLYLANQLDGLLIRSSNLIDGEYQTNSTDQTNNNILAHYLTISSDSEADKITQQKLGCFIDNEKGTTKKLNVTIPSGLDKMDFSDLYKMINDNFTISESDLYELFETYFNENRLLVFCNLYNDVLQHADDVIADIESVAQTTDRWPSPALEQLSITPEVWKNYFKPFMKYRTIDVKQRFSGNRKQRQRKAMWITSTPTLNHKFV